MAAVRTTEDPLSVEELLAVVDGAPVELEPPCVPGSRPAATWWIAPSPPMNPSTV